MELDQLLERTTEMNARLIAGIAPDRYGDATPCSEWTVRDVLNHIIGNNHSFAALAAGEQPDLRTAPDVAGDDPAAAYAQGAKVALEAWRAPGVAERIIHLPIGDVPGALAVSVHFVDHFVHGWDIARATGQEELVDQDLAEAAYGLVHGKVPEQVRQPGGPFGPEVDAPEGCSPADRLAAYLGRTP